MWQIRRLSRPAVWPAPHLVDRRAPGSRKSGPAPPRNISSRSLWTFSATGISPWPPTTAALPVANVQKRHRTRPATPTFGSLLPPQCSAVERNEELRAHHSRPYLDRQRRRPLRRTGLIPGSSGPDRRGKARPEAIDLRLAAETIDVDVETLRTLNPPLLRLATPDDASFELHLPEGSAEKFSCGDRRHPRRQVGELGAGTASMKAARTLGSIAKKYHVHPRRPSPRPTALNAEPGLDPGRKVDHPGHAGPGRKPNDAW